MEYDGYCRLILDMSDDISYITDVDTYELLFMTRAAMRFFNLKDAEEYQGKKCYQILQGQEKPCEFCIRSGGCENQFHRWTHYVEKIDKWMMFEDFQALIDGKLCRVGTACDITAEKKRSSRLSDSVVMETLLLQCIRILSMTDDLDTAVSAFLETLGRFYRADRAYILEVDKGGETFSNTFEWCRKGVSSERENIQNVPMSELQDLGKSFGNKDNIYYAAIGQLPPDSAMYRVFLEQGIQELLVTPLTIEGRISGFLGVDNPRANLERRGILQATADFVVEELKKRRMLRQLEYTSYTDMLTGAYNRNRYIDDLARIKCDTLQTFGVMIVDVNGLKRINDLYGHKHGDMLIQRAARILLENLREPVYRLGGDEFIILFPDISEKDLEDRLDVIKQRFSEESDCDVSVGVSWENGDFNIDKVIFRADEQMYAQKKSYYRSLLSEEQLINSGAAAKVRREIDDGIFVVHYQPQVDMQSGRIVGVETLVRKRDSEGGLRMPNRFIHFYEAHGMLPYVDIFVLKKAVHCYKALGFKEKGLTISVNVSRDTLLLPEFVRQMEVNCARHNMAPECLKLEVAHKSINPGNAELMKVLHSVRRAGFKLVLDAFGEIGSSLDILAEMEFDEIKFSKSMADGIEQRKQNRIMAGNLIRLCDEIQNAGHVIEGIENERQAAFFKEHHCPVAQGFYYYRPMCSEQLERLLSEKR